MEVLLAGLQGPSDLGSGLLKWLAALTRTEPKPDLRGYFTCEEIFKIARGLFVKQKNALARLPAEAAELLHRRRVLPRRGGGGAGTAWCA